MHIHAKATKFSKGKKKVEYSVQARTVTCTLLRTSAQLTSSCRCYQAQIPPFTITLLTILPPHSKNISLPHTIIFHLQVTVISTSHRTITLKKILKNHLHTLPTHNDVQSCIAHIPCASRALLPHRKFKILLHLLQRLSRGDSLEKPVLVSSTFFSFFSPFLVSLGKKSPQIPAAGYLQPLEHKFVRTRGLSSIPVLIQNILIPFLHSSLRCYDLKPTLPMSRLNHFVTSQVHDSAQCSSYRLPAVISIVAAKSSSRSNYHDNRPSSDQKTNRFFSRRCGSCFPQNHRRCIRP